MHVKLLKKYYFINSFDTNIINKQDKTTTCIYRDYKSLKFDVDKILRLKAYLKKRVWVKSLCILNR